MRRRVELFTIWLAITGSASAWIIIPLVLHPSLPSWISNGFPQYVCFPAAVAGSFAYIRHGGFAKSPWLISLLALMFAALFWTRITELNFGIAYAVTFGQALPVAALIRRNGYQQEAITLFAIAVTATMAFALFSPSIYFQYGLITSDEGQGIANSASVGVESTLALLFVVMSWPDTRRQSFLRQMIWMAIAGILTVAAFISGSRTGGAALVGALIVAGIRAFGVRPRTVFFISSFAVILVSIYILLQTSGFQRTVSTSLLSRSLENDQLDPLSGREDITAVALPIFNSDDNWLRGVGPGAVGWELGQTSALRFREVGPDGQNRAYAHNTYIWLALALGCVGLVIAACLFLLIGRRALLLDRIEHTWFRSAYVAFLVLAGFGIVINTEAYWTVAGAILWVMISESVDPALLNISGVAHSRSELADDDRYVFSM